MRHHLLSLAIVLAFLASLSGWRLLMVRDVAAASLELRQSQRRERSGPVDGPALTAYVARLQTTLPASPEVLLHQLQSSVGGDGARIFSVGVAPGGGTPQSLAFSDLSFVLEGGYGRLKASIDGLLAEHPDVVMEHLSMQRKASPAVVEAQLMLRVIGPPVNNNAR